MSIIKIYPILVRLVFFICLLFFLSTTQAKECTGPNGGTGGVGQPGRWVGIGDIGNPGDTTGYGAVDYEYSMLERPITVAEYVTFLNAVDPSGIGGFEGDLDQYGLVGYSNSKWQTLDYTGCNSVSQNFSASETGQLLISLVSMNQAARYANWAATGDINQGAYRFSSLTDGNASISSIDANYPGPRLPTENEYYKAAYWDTAAQQYNLYGTTSVDGSGNPLTGTLSSTGLIGSTLHPYPFTYGADSRGNCMVYVQSGQGGRSAYGISNLVGGFHDMMHPNNLSTSSIVLRPDNQFSNSPPSGDGSPFPHEHQRSTWRWAGVSPSTPYSSPSFRLVATPSACGPEPSTPVDYGDAPDTAVGVAVDNYRTLSNDNGPKHTIVNTLYLGATAPDNDADGYNSAGVGDDTSGTNDENSISAFPAIATTDTTYSLSNIPVYNITGTSATLYAWIDFNRNGRFDGNEAATVNVPHNTNTVNLSWNGLTGGVSGTSYIRFRLTTNTLANSNSSDVTLEDTRSYGVATNGEVEDYALSLSNVNSNPSIVNDINAGCPAGYTLNTSINYISNGNFSTLPGKTYDGSYISPSTWLSGDTWKTDSYYQGDNVPLYDRDVDRFNPENTSASVFNTNAIYSAKALFKFPGNSDYGMGEQNYLVLNGGSLGRSYTSWESQTISVDTGASYIYVAHFSNAAYTDIYTDAVNPTVRLGYKDSSWNNLSSSFYEIPRDLDLSTRTTESSDGDQWHKYAYLIQPTSSTISLRTEDNTLNNIYGDDYAIGGLGLFKCISTSARDYGDAPTTGTAPNTTDTNNYGEASHTIVSGVYLGAGDPDADSANQPSVNAGSAGTNGDDGDGTDDEDGISAFPTLIAGDNSYTLPAANITASGNGMLHAWIDFDGDGSFESTEHTSTTVTAGTLADDLNWTGQNTMNAGTTFARFRLTSDTMTSVDSATIASDGEVEDYEITILPAEVAYTAPTTSCKTNWYYWNRVNDTGNPSRFNPLYHGFNKISTNLGSDTWYQNTNAFSNSYLDSDPNFSLPEDTTPDFSEVFYGLSYYSLTPGMTISMNIADLGIHDAHALAAFDSAGNMLSRFPSISRVTSSGQYYVAEYAATHPGVDIEGIPFLDTPWSIADDFPGEDFSFTVPADGKVYLHRMIMDESWSSDPLAIDLCANDGSDTPADGATAPDSSSLTRYGTPTHIVNSALQLGLTIDAEASSVASANADGDGLDDDGITLPTLTQASSSTITAAVTGADGYLQGWVDFNGDGDFLDPGEQVVTNLQDGDALDTDAATGTIAFVVNVPAGATTNQTYARFRWSTTSGLDSTVAASDGEVEDYALPIIDSMTPFGCTDDFYFSNRDASNDVVFQRIDRSIVPYQNTPIGTPSSITYNAMGYNTLDNFIYAVAMNELIQIDKNGKVKSLGLIGGGYPNKQIYSGEFNKTGIYYVYDDGTNTLHGIDVANKTQISSISLSETITFWDMAIDATGDYFYAMSVDSNAPWSNKGLIKVEIATGNVTHIGTRTHEEKGSVYLVFSDVNGDIYMQDANNGVYAVDITTGELTWLSSSSSLGTYNDGTVCPNSNIVIPEPPVDYSDAPSSYGAAIHTITTGIQLGTLIDADAADQTSANADGDDSDGNDDDEGLSSFPTLTEGDTAYTVPAANITASGTGTLHAWIDFDGNGLFDTTEHTSTTITAGAISGDLNWTGQNTTSTTKTFVRLRFTSDTGITASIPSGSAIDGEVEDYSITINVSLKGVVFEDINYGGGAGRSYTTADATAVASGFVAGDIGIGSATVELYNATGTLISSTTTATDGSYSFSVSPGDYSIRVVNSTLTSNRTSNATGESIIPVQTYRTDGVTPYTIAGGVNPTAEDVAAGTLTGAQSVTPVTVTDTTLSGLDFGYNYSTIVNTNDSGQGSFRQFLLNANELSNANLNQQDDPANRNVVTKDSAVETSIFEITGTTTHQIQTLSRLVDIKDRIQVNGFTQHGSAPNTATDKDPLNGTLLIELDGSNAGSGVDGLRLVTGSANSIISGLSVVSYDDDGIDISAAATDNKIQGNYIGLHADGSTQGGMGSDGLTVASPNNIVGGINAEDRNIVSGNGAAGILLTGISASNNLVQNNYTGITKDGATPAPNTLAGIYLLSGDSNSVTGNVSSGNTQRGVLLNAQSNENTVTENYLGTDYTGTLAVKNGSGIDIINSSNNTIGSLTASERNVISANNTTGLSLFNASANNTIIGNYIGTDVNGISDLGNGTNGINLYNTTQNIIGGITNNAKNIIAGNNLHGVQLNLSNENIIKGNAIGLDINEAPLANNGSGILFTESNDNLVGGTETGATNIIANNTGDGIGVDETSNDNQFLSNSLYNNAELGIDLGLDEVSVNDTGDGDSGANDLLNYPILKNVIQDGTDLDLDFSLDVPAGSYRVEFFDNPIIGLDISGHGEGLIFIGSTDVVVPSGGLSSGSTILPNTTASNILNVVATVTELDTTKTSGFGSTSEFSAKLVISNLEGIVFEDVNYAGGIGRDLATSNGVAVNLATVELYDSDGNFIETTTTEADGSYRFSSVADDNYFVRVVNDTVSSTRSGSNGAELAVQTFRSNGSTSTTGEVGGRNPPLADSPANGGTETLNTTTFTLSGGGAVQSLQAVTVAGADVSNINFGFNFDTVVNTNDSGQGSLRQFILNANRLTDIPSQGLNTGYETSIFMIPDGTAYPGTSNHGALDLTTSGVALITPTSMLPASSNPSTAVDATTQNGAACGDPLSATPHTLKVQIDGTALTIGSVAGLQGSDMLIRGLSLTNFQGGTGTYSAGLKPGLNSIVQCNYLSVAPDGSSIGRNSRDLGSTYTDNVLLGGLSTGDGNVFVGGTSSDTSVRVDNLTNFRVFGNTFGLLPDGTHGLGVNQNGLQILGTSENFAIGGASSSHRNIFANGIYITTQESTGSARISGTIQGNYIGIAHDGQTTAASSSFLQTGITVSNNVDVLIGGSNAGDSNVIGGELNTAINLQADASAQVTNNLIGVAANGTTPMGVRQSAITIQHIGTHTLHGNIIANSRGNNKFYNANIFVVSFSGALEIGGNNPGDLNQIYGGKGSGILVGPTSQGAIIKQNAIYANARLGINLGNDDTTLNDANDSDTGGNGLLNFPQFTQTSLIGSNLLIKGCAPTGSSIELFEADVSPTSTSGATAGDNQLSLTQDYGEGETYLLTFTEGVGEDTVTTPTDCNSLVDEDGNTANGMSPFQWTVPLPTQLVLDDKITATATIIGTGTSEFSAVSTIAGLDYGDAPDTYKTRAVSNGPQHVIINDVFLGSSRPDVDNDGQPNITADGDGADEDGISSLSPLTTDLSSYTIDVKVNNTTSQPATLIAWIDFDRNGTFDPDESQVKTITAGTIASTIELGWYAIPADIQPGSSYLRIRITTDKISHLETGGVKKDGEVEDHPISIESAAGFLVIGRVYKDTNADGMNDSTETGVSGLPVVLVKVETNTANNTCVSTRTGAEGHYVFSTVLPGDYQLYEASRETVPTPENCDIAMARDPQTYRSTTNNVLTLFSVVDADIEGKDFGDINEPTFSPDNSGTVIENNVVLYAHTFKPSSTGSVIFNSTNSTAITSGWSNVIYQDNNCNSILDGTEANSAIITPIATTANTNICLINKVYAPNNVVDGETYSNEITADFDFNGNTIAGSITLKVTDLSTASANVTPTNPTVGSSKLELRKTVQNITQASSETEFQNQAKPNDVLKYRIYYSNTGTGPITDLKINDVVPEFTVLNGSPECQLPLPASLTTCSGNVSGDNIEWLFGDSDILKGGGRGMVSYQVTID